MNKEERIKAANRYSAQYLIHSLEEVANKAFIKGAEAEAESNKNVFEELRKQLVSKMPDFSAFEKLGTKNHSEWIGFSNAITALDNFLLNKY